MTHDDGLQRTDTRAFNRLSDSGDQQIIFPMDLERTNRNAIILPSFVNIGRSYVYFIRTCGPKELTLTQ